MQISDRIREVKIFLVFSAIVIAALSLIISHFLVRDLALEEHKKMEIWAEAMRSLNSTEENVDMALVLKVLEGNTTIPVIVLYSNGEVQTCRNIAVNEKTKSDSTAYIAQEAKRLRQGGKSIRIRLSQEAKSDYIDVLYDDSVMIKRLTTYPYVQLGVVLLFVVVAIFALLTSKRAEQNKVWVGLSKETAHQLGTPISSLMAWTEILRETYPEDGLIPEMSKDVKRLELIAERFSKIGSKPELKEASLQETLLHVVDYMNRRTSEQVLILTRFPDDPVCALINASLFEWVIENLCKNAVDAMEGKGSITLTLYSTARQTVLEVSDTGKGIRKKDIPRVFKPGFTTKKRGWGLGLSLAKRIICEYHHGKIYVKQSEIGKGTTFRIELKKQ